MSANDAALHNLIKLLFQSHPWHGVEPLTDAPDTVEAFIEIVPTDVVKYELDKASGRLRLDRPQLYSSLCPVPYGFIPQSFCGDTVAELCASRTGLHGVKGDSDPLDICVLTEKTMAHGNFFVRAKIVGGLRMIDGIEADDKIIAVLENDIAYGHIQDIHEAPGGLIDRLKHYFLTYKQLPEEAPRRVEIADVYKRAEAMEVITRSLHDYRARYGAPDERIRELRRLLKAED